MAILKPSIYALPPANDVVDGLLEMIRSGTVVPLSLNGRVRFCAKANMKPEYEALVVDYAAAEADLKHYAEQAMAVWN